MLLVMGHNLLALDVMLMPVHLLTFLHLNVMFMFHVKENVPGFLGEGLLIC